MWIDLDLLYSIRETRYQYFCVHIDSWIFLLDLWCSHYLLDFYIGRWVYTVSPGYLLALLCSDWLLDVYIDWWVITVTPGFFHWLFDVHIGSWTFMLAPGCTEVSVTAFTAGHRYSVAEQRSWMFTSLRRKCHIFRHLSIAYNKKKCF